MRSRPLWCLAKALEGIGMVVVLVGVLISIDRGLDDEGLKSMAYEGYGLLVGGGLFVAGYVLERAVGAR